MSNLELRTLNTKLKTNKKLYTILWLTQINI